MSSWRAITASLQPRQSVDLEAGHGTRTHERSVRAEERLGIMSRQVRRLAKRYRDQGPVGLLSLRRNQRSNNQLDSSIEARLAGILRDSCADFGMTLAAEKLEALYQIRLSKDTEDSAENRRLIGKYIDVSTAIPYSTYDKFGVITQGAIVENKRFGQVLHVAQLTQAKRDSRSVSGPSTAHRPNGVHIPRNADSCGSAASAAILRRASRSGDRGRQAHAGR